MLRVLKGPFPVDMATIQVLCKTNLFGILLEQQAVAIFNNQIVRESLYTFTLVH